MWCVAQFLSRKKSLYIKHLRDSDSRVTGNLRRRPLIGAVVEFLTRAGAGFARD